LLPYNRNAVPYAASLRDVADGKSDQIRTAQSAIDCQIEQGQIALFRADLIKHLELHVDNESGNGHILSVRPASAAITRQAVEALANADEF
jgi:hypothetical protein